MDNLTRKGLESLAARAADVCVSIYLPTRRAGMGKPQGAIRLKNHLKRAVELHYLTGARPARVREITKPAEGLVKDSLFWQHQDEGLALFLSPEGMVTYRLPIRFGDLVVLGRRFHVKPLLPLFSVEGRFFVLALSRNRVRLLKCTRYHAHEVSISSAPRNMAEAMRYDGFERQLQFHTRTSPAAPAGRRQAILHGHGTGIEDDKDDILRYFLMIDRGLQEVLRNERSPLVLAGVGYLFGIYREANSYPYLVEGGIEGNPDDMSLREMHARAWDIVKPEFMREERTARENYERLSNLGDPRASDDLEKVLPAAYTGRVDTLFIEIGAHRWGTFDPDTLQVEQHQEPRTGDDDLVDLAAVQTLLNGGAIYPSQPGDMPASAPVAAVMRY
ncbi:MAG: hypothetical protein WAR22_00090 [Desulfomonilia bacterium]